jgi:hypothetical protein
MTLSAGAALFAATKEFVHGTRSPRSRGFYADSFFSWPTLTSAVFRPGLCV